MNRSTILCVLLLFAGCGGCAPEKEARAAWQCSPARDAWSSDGVLDASRNRKIRLPEDPGCELFIQCCEAAGGRAGGLVDLYCTLAASAENLDCVQAVFELRSILEKKGAEIPAACLID